jgi:hypothetical protein
MAFTVTSRYSYPGTAENQYGQVSSSFTPAANSLLVVVALNQRYSFTTTLDPQCSDSSGLTWTRVALSSEIAGSYGGDLAVFTAPVGASPSATTVTVWHGITPQYCWTGVEIFDITGHNTTTPLAQAATTNTTTSTGNSVSLTVTLGSAPTSGNLVLGLFGGQNDAAGAFGTPTGYTQLSAPTGTFSHCGVWYNTSTTTAAITNPDLGQSVNWGAGAALEIAASGAGGTNATKTPADSAGATDTTTVVKAVVKAPADSAGGSDSAAVVKGVVRTAADSAGATDSVTASLSGGGTDYTKSPADNAGATDSVTVAVDRVVTVADSAGASDTDNPQMLDVVYDVSDSAGATDSATRQTAFVRAPSDSAGGSDSATADVAGGGVTSKSAADSAGGSDSLSLLMQARRSLAESGGATDAASVVKALVRSAADTAGATDSVAALLGFALDRSAADAAGATDAVSVSLVSRIVFTPPSYDYRVGDHPLWRRVLHQRGNAVVVYGSGAIVTSTVAPSIDGTDVVRVYSGGRQYVISSDEATALTDAGYGEYIEGVSA